MQLTPCAVYTRIIQNQVQLYSLKGKQFRFSAPSGKRTLCLSMRKELVICVGQWAVWGSGGGTLGSWRVRSLNLENWSIHKLFISPHLGNLTASLASSSLQGGCAQLPVQTTAREKVLCSYNFTRKYFACINLKKKNNSASKISKLAPVPMPQCSTIQFQFQGWALRGAVGVPWSSIQELRTIWCSRRCQATHPYLTLSPSSSVLPLIRAEHCHYFTHFKVVPTGCLGNICWLMLRKWIVRVNHVKHVVWRQLLWGMAN